MILKFLLFSLFVGGVSESPKDSGMKTFTNKFSNWSISVPACYQIIAASDESTVAGSAEFLNSSCKGSFDYVNVSSLPTNDDSIDIEFKKYNWKTGMKKLKVNGHPGLLYLVDRRSSSGSLKKVSWYVKTLCNGDKIQIMFTTEIEASLVDFLRRQTKLKGPSKESMKILNTFQCHKKKSKGK